MKKTKSFLTSLLTVFMIAGCDFIDRHEHTFKAEFAHDETNHWHEASCEHTNLINELVPHNFGDDNVCDDCGYTKPTVEVPHEHTFKVEFAHDETNHWHEASCEHTNLNSELVPHNFGDDNVCDDCGYEKPTPAHEHTYFEEWSKDENNHWHALNCGHTGLVNDFAEHEYGDDDVCDICGFVKPAPAHEHTFENTWSKDETNHWHAASCEHIDLSKDLTAHEYGDDNICDACGYEKPAPAHEHTFKAEWESDSESHWHEASCEHIELFSEKSAHIDSDENNICDVCGYVIPVEHVHTFSDWIKDETNHWKEATCEHTDLTKDLTAHEYGDDNICDVCGYEKPAPAHEHQFSTEWSTDEIKHWHASTCDHAVVSDLDEHTFGDDDLCTVCGYKKFEQHTITYVNWPDEIENPNPTQFDRKNYFTFDGSNISEKEGFSNVKFLVESKEVTSLEGIDDDVTVTVSYDASITKITVNPNNTYDDSFTIDVPYWSMLSDLIGTYTKSAHVFVGWFDDNGEMVDINQRWTGLDSELKITAKWNFEYMYKYIEKLEEFKTSLIVEAAKAIGETQVFSLLVDQLDRLTKSGKTEMLKQDYTKEEADELYEKHTTALNTAAVTKIIPELSRLVTDAYQEKMRNITSPEQALIITEFYTSHLTFGTPETPLAEVVSSYQMVIMAIKSF